MAKHLVVFLHGFGSNGADLLELGQLWKERLPGVIFAAPDAPFVSDAGFGYQWFSLAGVSEQNRPERIIKARTALDATLARLFAQHNVDPQQDRVVLVGFSQGSIMSLDMLVSRRLPLAGVVAFSGRLSTPEPWVANPTPSLLIHGKADAVIPWQNSQQASLQLTSAGFNTSLLLEDGLAHGISNQGAQAAAEFIAACFTQGLKPN